MPTLIEAVLSTSSGNFYSDFDKLFCLTNFLNSKEGYNTFLSIRRILNILTTIKKFSKLDKKLFNKHEQSFYDALAKARTEVQPKLTQENFNAVLKIFERLAKTINIFFDKVLVMDDDMTLRANRLTLLNEVSKLFLSVTDFSHVDL